MKTILPLFLLSMLSTTVSARLGETFDQCIARYGVVEARNAETGTCRFEKEGYVITAHFAAGKVDCITYQNIDGTEVNQSELQALADGNLGKGWWGGDGATTMQPKHGGGNHGTISNDKLMVKFFTHAYWTSVLDAGGSIMDSPDVAPPRAAKLFTP